MAKVTAEQEAEFKRRRAAGATVSNDEVKAYIKTGARLSPKQIQAFLKATDSKCDGDS